MRRKLLLLLPAIFLLSCESALKESPQYGSPTGQVTTAATLTPPPNPCLGCALAPTTFTRVDGKTPVLKEFAGDPQADYLLVVQDDGQEGTGAEIKLNGETIVPKTALLGFGVAELKLSVKVKAANRLTVLPVGKVGAKVTLWMLAGAKVVGPTGGVITAPAGRASLTIPAGALAQGVDIQIVLDSTAPALDTNVVGIRGRVITLQPDGLAFSTGAWLSIPAPPGIAPSDMARADLYWQDTANNLLFWQPGGYDPVSNTVTAAITHFSNYQMVIPPAFNGGGSYEYYVSNPPNMPKVDGTKLTRNDVYQEAARAVAGWNYHLRNVGGSGIRFVSRQSASTSAIEIGFSRTVLARYFGSSTPPSGYTLYGAVAYDMFSGQRFVFLNDFVSWYSAPDLVGPAMPQSNTDQVVERVLQHEFGHILGLSHYNFRICDAPGAPTTGSCQEPPVMAAQIPGVWPLALRDPDLINLAVVYGSQVDFRSAAKILPTSASVSGTAGALVSPSPSVVVVDKNNQPVGGVTVLYAQAPGSGGSVSSAVQVTDNAGVATAGGWRLGTSAASQHLSAYFYSANWNSTPSGFEVSQFDATVNGVSPPAGSITGTVRDNAGRRLLGLSLTASPSGVAATTNGSGIYLLASLPSGSATVSLSSKGLAAGCSLPPTQNATVPLSGSIILDFTVNCSSSSKGSLTGQVVWNGKGQANVTVTAAGLSTTTDAAGYYGLPNVPIGSVVVAVSRVPAGCQNPPSVTANVSAGATSIVSFSLSCVQLGTIAGTVTSSLGGRLANVTATTQPSGISGVTNSAGTYSLSQVPSGNVTVGLSGLPGGCSPPAPIAANVQAGAMATVNFLVQCQSLSGTWTGTQSLNDPPSAPAVDYALKLDFTNNVALSSACINQGTIQSVTPTQIVVDYPSCGTETISNYTLGTSTLIGSGVEIASSGGRTVTSTWTLTSTPPTASGLWTGTQLVGAANYTLQADFGAGTATSGFCPGVAGTLITTQNLLGVLYPNCAIETVSYSIAGQGLTATGTLEQRLGGQQLVSSWQLNAGSGAASLLAYYPLDGNGSDAGPNPINGTVTNASFVPGRIGSALHFTGGASYMEVPIAVGSKLALKTTDQFTTAMWIRPDQLGAPGGNALALEAGINDFGWSTQVQGNGIPLVNACTLQSFCVSAVAQSVTLSTGNWYHIAQVYDGVHNTMEIYVDGQFRGTANVSFNAKTTDQFLYLGSPKHATQYGFAGSVDDVRIYSGVLSAAQIAALASQGGGSGSGPVAFYPLDGNGNDASGNGNNGTVSGAVAAAGHTGQAGTALSFSGSSVVTIPTNPILKGLTGDMTLVYWVKKGTSSIVSTMIPVSRRVPSDIIHFESYAQPGGFGFQCCSPGGSATGMFYAPSGNGLNTINDGAWHQIAVTRRFGSGGFTELYLDGVYVLGSYTSGSPSDAAPSIDAALLIGRQDSGSPGQFAGFLDDVYIYNRILTQPEIQALP